MSTKSQAVTTCDCDNVAVTIHWCGGQQSRLPHLWCRDNCDCGDCRIAQTSEKRFLLADVPVDLSPRQVKIADDVLYIEWPDGHQTRYDGNYLRALHRDPDSLDRDWPEGYVPRSYDYAGFLTDDSVASSAIDEFLETGAIVLANAPTKPGTLEYLAPRLGPIREVLFDRIHDVRVDPRGYNIAHTPLPLPPHNDFASYTWPPSVQALHMLVNETVGGRTIIVDGWDVLKQLKIDEPAMFDVLSRTAVPFREFDDNNETYAIEPIIRLGAGGEIAGFRFSNQLMQVIDPNLLHAVDFYRAYHELCCRISDHETHVRFRLEGGQILVVAAHRVLHGREAFSGSGRRHLQDAYFEFDNIRNYRTVLRQREGFR